ncbi:MAG: type VI secretion system tip protein VgrG [Sandaracinaceae bacterium]|nr:type VI secretion system tip protein VgrG [Sandaracinaceae bacterium]
MQPAPIDKHKTHTRRASVIAPPILERRIGQEKAALRRIRAGRAPRSTDTDLACHNSKECATFVALTPRAAPMTEVSFELSIDQLPVHLAVREMILDEQLNGLPTCNVSAFTDAPLPPVRELLRSNCRLELRRAAEQRFFRGIVWQARTSALHSGGFGLDLRITTAAQLLTRIVDTYMYQDKSAPEIVKDLVERYLGRRQRTVDVGLLQRTYPIREYTLQYNESVFAFLSRLCEEEGIFFFFDHAGAGSQHELLVLADKAGGLPRARSAHGGSVPFVQRESYADEGVTALDHVEEVGATDVVLDGYDWTNRDVELRRAQTGRDRGDPALEVYDPHDSIYTHDYRNEHYAANNAVMQAEARAELLDFEREAWHLQCNVVTAQPGHLLTINGAPEHELDGEYLLIGTTTRGTADSEHHGRLQSSAQCIPSSMQYRPPRVTPRPTVHGPETARVVGASSDEIHTDEHGRVKVQFHWDRQHRRDEHSSCGIRVAQSWAGQGFGTLVIPRVDREVVVSCLGGNPDRPLITGCVYNDKNRPHVALPQDKSQSAIRTKSTAPGAGGSSSGYNEILFEDKLGAEFISVHAQRDLLEEVLHDRTTQIRHDDRLTVTNNSYTHVHHEETRTVDGDARWTYKSSWSRNVNYLETFVGCMGETSDVAEYYRNQGGRLSEFYKSASSVTTVREGDYVVRTNNGDTAFIVSGFCHAIGLGGLSSLDPAAILDSALSTTAIALSVPHGTLGIGARFQLRLAVPTLAGATRISMAGPTMHIDAQYLRIRGGSQNVGVSQTGERVAASLSTIVIEPDHLLLKHGPSYIKLSSSGIEMFAPMVKVMGGSVTRGASPHWD